MSLFQCSKCGCVENTASTNAYWGMQELAKAPEVEASYRVVLGLLPWEPLGRYCSACSPIWLTEKGDYGLGPNPSPKSGEGLWHGIFKRRYLPKGKFKHGPGGTLLHRETLNEYFQYVADEEFPDPPKPEPPPPATPRTPRGERRHKKRERERTAKQGAR